MICLFRSFIFIDMSALILSEIPEPFMFNVLKHHKGVVKKFAARFNRQDLPEAAAILNRNMSNLMTDFYIGDLMPGRICEEIRENLISRDLYDRPGFLKWVRQVNKKFRLAGISDGSTWILLHGRDEGRYLHIHPARESLHAVRIRSLAYKTAVLLWIAGFSPDDPGFELHVNDLRGRYLGEPPLRGLQDMKNIVRIYDMLRK